MDVRAPRALINATSFFLIWAYPELAVNPPNGDVADIREVQITYKPEADNEDTVAESFPSLNVTIGGLFSDKIYTITVRVVYDRPNLIGEGVVLNIQTLPEGVSFICTCTYTCMYVLYVCMYVYIYVCVCVCMYVCMYAVFCPEYLEWWLDSTLHLVLFIQYILNTVSVAYICII